MKLLAPAHKTEARLLDQHAIERPGAHAGSDAGAMPDKGIVCMGDWEGKQTLGLRVTWEKRYITLGPVATLLGLAFKAYDPEHLLGDEQDLGISLALIPTDTPGVDIVRNVGLAGEPADEGSHALIHYDEVRVPAARPVIDPPSPLKGAVKFPVGCGVPTPGGGT